MIRKKWVDEVGIKWDISGMKGSKAFQIYEKKRASGVVNYRVYLGMVNGTRKFKNFGKKAAAEAYRNQCIASHADQKPVVLQELNEATRHDVLAALERLRLAGATITEAVDFYLKHSKPSKGNIHLATLVEEWEKVKKGQACLLGI